MTGGSRYEGGLQLLCSDGGQVVLGQTSKRSSRPPSSKEDFLRRLLVQNIPRFRSRYPLGPSFRGRSGKYGLRARAKSALIGVCRKVAGLGDAVVVDENDPFTLSSRRPRYGFPQGHFVCPFPTKPEGTAFPQNPTRSGGVVSDDQFVTWSISWFRDDSGIFQVIRSSYVGITTLKNGMD